MNGFVNVVVEKQYINTTLSYDDDVQQHSTIEPFLDGAIPFFRGESQLCNAECMQKCRKDRGIAQEGEIAPSNTLKGATS